MNLRFALLVAFLQCSGLSSAQWNAQKIEAFAGEFRLVADSLPKHKVGQMMGALASLGIKSFQSDLASWEKALDALIADPTALKAQVKADREAVSFVNLMFNVTAIKGDYAKATRLLNALGGTMYLLGAETAFLDAPYASQQAILPLLVGSADQVDLLGAMMKSAALDRKFDKVPLHADQITTLVDTKSVEPTVALLNRYFDLKFYGKAVDYVAAKPSSTSYAANLARVAGEAFRGGDFESLDRIAVLLKKSLTGKPIATSPELVFVESLRSSDNDPVVAEAAKIVRPTDYQFSNYLERHAEALSLRSQLSKIEALKAAYPKSQDAILRGVISAHVRADAQKAWKEAVPQLTKGPINLEFLIKAGLFDEAAMFYAQVPSLDARTQFYGARNIAKGLLEAGQVARSVEFLQKAKARLQTPDPGFNWNDSTLTDLAILYGQSGDLATMKELLAKRKVNDYPKPAEALHQSFMAAYRLGLVRK